MGQVRMYDRPVRAVSRQCPAIQPDEYPCAAKGITAKLYPHLIRLQREHEGCPRLTPLYGTSRTLSCQANDCPSVSSTSVSAPVWVSLPFQEAGKWPSHSEASITITGILVSGSLSRFPVSSSPGQVTDTPSISTVTSPI